MTNSQIDCIWIILLLLYILGWVLLLDWVSKGY